MCMKTTDQNIVYPRGLVHSKIGKFGSILTLEMWAKSFKNIGNLLPSRNFKKMHCHAYTKIIHFRFFFNDIT